MSWRISKVIVTLASGKTIKRMVSVYSPMPKVINMKGCGKVVYSLLAVDDSILFLFLCECCLVVDDMRHGSGKMTFFVGSFLEEQYDGEWANDERHG